MNEPTSAPGAAAPADSARPKKFSSANAPDAQPAAVSGHHPGPRTMLAMVLEWEELKRISDIPAVHEALKDFSDDPTGDNGVYIIREVLKAAPGPAASVPAVARHSSPIALPTIAEDEMKALRRFDECVTDGEGYDVSKEMMRRLAGIGLVRRTSGAIYEHTDFGLFVLGKYIPTEVPHER